MYITIWVNSYPTDIEVLSQYLTKTVKQSYVLCIFLKITCNIWCTGLKQTSQPYRYIKYIPQNKYVVSVNGFLYSAWFYIVLPVKPVVDMNNRVSSGQPIS